MRRPFPHPLILGHRGAPLEAPENTLRSFALALTQGADGVELDVRLARDGVPVIIHDPTLGSTPRDTAAVAELDWPALQRLTGAQLASLPQAAAWAAAAGAWLNVELKVPGVEKAALDCLDEAGLLPRTFISSFLPEVVREVGRIRPASMRFLLRERWDGPARDALAWSGAGGVCLEVEAATADALASLSAAGLPVVVWTVDDAARMAELLRAGVDGIITNLPAVGAAARREAQVGSPT